MASGVICAAMECNICSFILLKIEISVCAELLNGIFIMMISLRKWFTLGRMSCFSCQDNRLIPSSYQNSNTALSCACTSRHGLGVLRTSLEVLSRAALCACESELLKLPHLRHRVPVLSVASSTPLDGHCKTGMF